MMLILVSVESVSKSTCSHHTKIETKAEQMRNENFLKCLSNIEMTSTMLTMLSCHPVEGIKKNESMDLRKLCKVSLVTLSHLITIIASSSSSFSSCSNLRLLSSPSYLHQILLETLESNWSEVEEKLRNGMELVDVVFVVVTALIIINKLSLTLIPWIIWLA